MNKLIRKAGNSVVNGTCAVLGALHFVTDTTSDILLSAEAKLKHRRYGQEEQDAKRERCLKTIKLQNDIIDRVEAITNSIAEAKARFSGQPVEHPQQMTTAIILVPMNEAMSK